MIDLFSNRYCRFTYEDDTEFLHQAWHYTHSNNNLFFCQGVNDLIWLLKHYEVNKAVIDFTKFHYEIDAATQKWLEREIFSTLLNLGFKQMALLGSKHSPTQNTLQHVFNDQNFFRVSFFSDEQKAKQWLLNRTPKQVPPG